MFTFFLHSNPDLYLKYKRKLMQSGLIFFFLQDLVDLSSLSLRCHESFFFFLNLRHNINVQCLFYLSKWFPPSQSLFSTPPPYLMRACPLLEFKLNYSFLGNSWLYRTMVVLELFHIKDRKNLFITVCSQNQTDHIKTNIYTDHNGNLLECIFHVSSLNTRHRQPIVTFYSFSKHYATNQHSGHSQRTHTLTHTHKVRTLDNDINTALSIKDRQHEEQRC